MLINLKKSEKNEILIINFLNNWYLYGYDIDKNFNEINLNNEDDSTFDEINNKLIIELNKNVRDYDRGFIYMLSMQRLGFPIEYETKEVFSIKLFDKRFLIIGTNEPSIIFYDLFLNETVNEIFLDPNISTLYGLDVKGNLFSSRLNINDIGIWELQYHNFFNSF